MSIETPLSMDNDGEENYLLNLSLCTPPSRPEKSVEIAAPYPWATERRATVQSMEQLRGKGIDTISGSVQCKRCDKQFEVEYEVAGKFREVAQFIMEYREEMRHRAPAVWMAPTLPDCRFCEQRNCAKPVASKKKKDINWLFLFLGQMVGCCKLAELKYFCKHTRKHRTGAKDRVLYLTYLEICTQLHPHTTFH
ncbi:uncharacterized protein LOC130997619 [Salvia miltiorrhiza]|uniref:uncharacterized protein LOC130997619 n=1 Tax=Salvia miltiorrhiza TaxID=226208 RepID=UPI0025AD4200|nr:uncharacterized protein LOC130997619 [Salvia miltiorrhiza]